MRFLLSILVVLALMIPVFAEDYPLTVDSLPQDGVPKGSVTQHRWDTSEVFAGTTRDYWVYVPAQYDGSKPACVMVFQDGGNYVALDKSFRIPTVFDNLIHKGEMPVTIGIFIDPGVFPVEGDKPKRNRSVEYDTLSDDYARFLLEEIIPEVGKTYKLIDNAQGRAICGISSGGICAFTVAWERPDAFHKVISHVGSFTNIRGGHVYPALIRRAEKRNIRVHLQDGENDLDNAHGSWPLGNLQMEAALKFSEYDYAFVMGTEGHNGKHGGAILPDQLRWIWRDYPGGPAGR
ncbi:MAG: alpha/beta hydrolase-fold protein [Candidatus Hydrogenedentota bacterium]